MNTKKKSLLLFRSIDSHADVRLHRKIYVCEWRNHTDTNGGTPKFTNNKYQKKKISILRREFIIVIHSTRIRSVVAAIFEYNHFHSSIPFCLLLSSPRPPHFSLVSTVFSWKLSHTRFVGSIQVWIYILFFFSLVVSLEIVLHVLISMRFFSDFRFTMSFGRRWMISRIEIGTLQNDKWLHADLTLSQTRNNNIFK